MRDVLVIGGGVAGLQAAVFTAKAGLDTLVLSGSGEPLVCSTDKIQNLVTHDRIAGEEIIETGRGRVRAFGGVIEDATVTRLTRNGPDAFTATTEATETYDGESVVVATADEFDFLEPLDDELEYTNGRAGEFTMEQHIETDDANRATDGVYVAGLANTWEYQTSVAIGDGAKAAVHLISDRRDEAYIDHDW